MQLKIVSHESDTNLIFIFLGWGMDDRPFLSLHKKGHTIAVAFNYDGSDDEIEQYRSFTSKYKNVSVIAWSYGVCIANRMLDGNENHAIAINGVVKPVDDSTGIPQRIFNLTLNSLSAESMLKFYSFTGLSESLPQRCFDSLKEELKMFGSKNECVVSPHWKTVYISERDRIIPPLNQLKHWEKSSVEIRRVDNAPHYIDLGQVINQNIIDKELVSKRFSENIISYESEAEVQKTVAATLYSMFSGCLESKPETIIEIGCGTGFLTRLYSAEIDTTKSVAVDIARKEAVIEAFENADVRFRGEIIEADAEVFLDSTDCKYDALLSSSAIQWFCSIPKFFTNTARILQTGGIAAIATYISGTFTNISDSRLYYYNAEDIFAMVPEDMDIVDYKTINHDISFSSAKDLLRHIRHTGVNAISSDIPPAGKMRKMISTLERDPHLRFSTLYLILRKK